MFYSLRSLMIVVTAASLVLGAWARMRYVQAQIQFHSETAKRERHDAYDAWLDGLVLELSLPEETSVPRETQDAQRREHERLAGVDEVFHLRWEPFTTESTKMAVRSKKRGR